ncbi:hypothetical protein MG293_000821 [Ovis ammon polii]|uniref:Uncharacterized protein n=1 Tax=Ovis ammon polii TaxID=230172 RepID=A0AAD4UNK3_OVIAM|nr:hypothetical protein MG293_000821 [Ovis ammon polii]
MGNSSNCNSSSSDSSDNSFLSSSSRGQSVGDGGALAVCSAWQEQHDDAGASPVGAAARVPGGGRLESLQLYLSVRALRLGSTRSRNRRMETANNYFRDESF